MVFADEMRAARTARIDALTAAAIGVAAYLIADMSHEGLGHGGACMLAGGKVLQLTSTYLQCSLDDGWRSQFVTAAGSVVNVIEGALAFGVLAAMRHRLRPWSRYFWWLLATVNLIVAGGYLMVSPLAGFGDWFVFASRTAHPLPIKIGLTLIGIALGLIGAKISAAAISSELGVTTEERRARIKLLTWSAYLGGSSMATLAGCLNPLGWKLVVISAIAASFCGTCWLVFLVPGFAAKRRAGIAAVPWPRHRWWLVVGAVATLIGLWCGRGFKF